MRTWMVFCPNAPAVVVLALRRDDDSDVSDDDEDDGGGDAVPASEAQIRKMFLKRATLEKWISEPYFPAASAGVHGGAWASGWTKSRASRGTGWPPSQKSPRART